MMENRNFNAIAILDEPLVLDGTIYAFMFDKEKEKQSEGSPFKTIDDYIAYNKGVSVWLTKYGLDSISNDLDTFHYDGVCLQGVELYMAHVFVALFRGEAKYKIYEFDEPIQYKENEVADKEPCVVVSPTLIERIKNSVKE